MTARTEFAIGSRVMWRYRPPGAYGCVVQVAGIVRKCHGAVATIVVAQKVAGQWHVESRRVRTSSLTLRTKLVAELDGKAWHEVAA
jgi:hypothetical protein